jgi:hypothetical protein
MLIVAVRDIVQAMLGRVRRHANPEHVSEQKGSHFFRIFDMYAREKPAFAFLHDL